MSPVSMAEAMVGEFRLEAVSTRKLLERVPQSSFWWAPHAKSMTLARLATHLADLPRWASLIVGEELYDLEGGNPVEPAGQTTELVERFDYFSAEFESNLSGCSDEHLLEPWRLVHGDRVIVELRRIAALRSFVISHLIHHRGQLTVYLRLLEVPLPQVYGPSADDRGGFG